MWRFEVLKRGLNVWTLRVSKYATVMFLLCAVLLSYISRKDQLRLQIAKEVKFIVGSTEHGVADTRLPKKRVPINQVVSKQ